MELDHLIAEAISHGDKDFIRFVATLIFVARQFFKAGNTGLRLRLPPLRILSHPFQFVGNRLGAGFLLTLFHLQAFFLLIEPRGVVPLPRNAFTAVKFENPLRRVVEEVPVMRHRDHRTGEAVQELLEPFHAFRIKMVRRFVKKQHVGTRQEKAAQGHPALFTAREVLDDGVPRRQAQSIRRNFHLGLCVGAGCGNNGFEFRLLRRERVKVRIGLRIRRIDFIQALLRCNDFAHPFFNHILYGRFRVEFRFLGEIPNFEAAQPRDIAVDILIHARHNLEERGFTGTVQTQYADLGPREERQRNVFQNLTFRGNRFAHPIHGHHILSH